MHILIIEDEEQLCCSIAEGLRMNGYETDTCFDGNEGLELCMTESYDLILLDLNLPGTDGLDILQQFRASDSITPVLILSARGQIQDKVEGLDLGANDYLTKPFEFKELEARIRCLLRRNFTTRSSIQNCGCLKMDTAAKQVWCSDKEVELTRKEYALLEYLFVHRDKMTSAEELIEHAWDSEADLFSNSFRFHIHSLRKKLDAAGAEGYIVTQRGLGYRLQSTEDSI